MHAIIAEKETMNLKETKERYMGKFRGQKGKRKYNLKNF